MDRVLPAEVLRRKKQKKWAIAAAIVLAVLLSIFGFRSLLSTSIDRSRLRFATVVRGDIEQTVTATGQVVPEYEQRIVTPIQAGLQAVLLPAGSLVAENQSILQLDKQLAENQRNRLHNEWKLADNRRAKLAYTLQQELAALRTQQQIQQLRKEQLQRKLEETQHLVKVGGKNQKEADQVQLELSIAELELSQLQSDLTTRKGSLSADLAAQKIQVAIAKNALEELDTKLKQASVAPTKAGIVTWVNENIGSVLQASEEVARVADLSSFRVVASISAVHAEKLSPGMPAIVQVNQQKLRGSITSIEPGLSNNALKFIVALDDKQAKVLRPNLKVQVHVVTELRENVLKVANGPAFTGKKYEQLFLLNDNELTKREVPIGLSNFSEVELQGNIAEGEQLVLSRLKEYEHLNTIEIND